MLQRCNLYFERLLELAVHLLACGTHEEQALVAPLTINL